MSVNPFESPTTNNFAPPPAQHEPKEKLRRVAQYQQWMILSLLMMIVTNVANYVLAGSNQMISLLMLAVWLGVVAFAVVSTWLLCRELIGIVGTVISVVLLFLPLIGLITLLVINQKASDFLKKNGVKVGFLGTSPSKIT
jgi:hypothetical protein